MERELENKIQAARRALTWLRIFQCIAVAGCLGGFLGLFAAVGNLETARIPTSTYIANSLVFLAILWVCALFLSKVEKMPQQIKHRIYKMNLQLHDMRVEMAAKRLLSNNATTAYQSE